jgi:outer membrane protein OmpA-like peptidoglycan-associated protein
MPVKRWSIATVVMLIPLAGHAADIRQRPFSHALETVTALEVDQFVVCSDCPDSRLSRMPATPKLSVRLSMPAKPEFPIWRDGEQPRSTTGETAGREVGLGAVQFDFDSTALSIHEREKLDGLLAGLPGSSSFALTGYSCTIGRSDYNDALSLRRANHVAGILRENGLKVGTVEGKGSCCPVSSDKARNRRVEIIEQRREEK